jgi:hypothetical protein
MRVSEAVAPVFELKGWSMADFIPLTQGIEIPFNMFIGVLQGNVIELKPSMFLIQFIGYFSYRCRGWNR